MNIENWLNTELGIKIWENKYRYNNESLEQWFNRVSGNNKDIKQLIKERKFLFGGRTLNNRGLNNGSYSNCFVPGTKVLTKNGYKNIEDIKVGDLVLTKDNTYQIVNDTFKNYYEGNLIVFNSSNLIDTIKCTPNHKFLTNRGWVSAEEIKDVAKYQSPKNYKLRNSFKKIEEEDVLVDLFELLHPICDRLAADNKHVWLNRTDGKRLYDNAIIVNRYIRIDSELKYLFGRYLGDGSITNNKTLNQENYIFQIVFNNETEIEDYIKCKNIINSHFGNICTDNSNEEQNTAVIKINSSIVGEFFNFYCGKKENKHFPDQFKNDINIAIGLLDSDGSVSKTGGIRIWLKLDTLMKDLYNCLINNNLSIPKYTNQINNKNYRINKLEISKGASINLIPLMSKKYSDNRMLNYIPKTKQYYEITDATYINVWDITEELYCGYVYNISVEVNHDYIVNGINVHNCYSSGYVEDSLEEIMKVNTNLAFTYKAEGGQGVSLSKIRPKGCLIKNRYESDGIVPFMEMFNVTTSSLKQGGCISENSRVLTNKGYIPIKDIKIGDKAWTKLGWIDINFLFDKGEQEVFEVITKKGYRIETTSDHKYCIDAFNSKKLSDLSIGDKINLISGNTLGIDQYLNTGEKVSEELAYFIGYLNGNGWIADNQKSGQLTMHWDQVEIKNKLIDIIKFLGFDTYVSDYKENSYLRLHISQELISWLSTNNLFKNKTKYIKIPDFIFNCSKEIISSYISGCIDSDGTVYETSFKYSTISKDYAYKYTNLLQLLGYFPSISVQYREDREPLYEISDGFRRNQYLPTQSIKFNNKFENFTTNSKYRTPYTLENINLKAAETGVVHLKKISKKSEIGLYSYLDINNKPFVPIIYDEILEINPLGIKKVYDISLVEEHFFMCEGFYVSNSRKGALMISIDITHKEAETFITIKSDLNRINNANLSVEIDDDFMKIVEESYKSNTEIKMNCIRTYGSQTIEYDIIPIKLYKLLIKLAHLSAEPGVLFVNRFRNYNLMEFCDDYQIETCNPCLHPDSIIETTEGKVKIKDMTKPMMVYSMDDNGQLVIKKASPSWITKNSAKTISIKINNGQVLTCTPDHKIFIQGKGWIEAQDIKIGDSPVALLRRRRGVKYSGVRLSSQEAGSDIMEHRLIYEAHYGNIPDGYDIHHIDNDSYNNIIDNLECISHSEHSTLTRYECDNNHQVHDKDGKFISTGKKPKTIIPLPEDLCTNFKSKPRVVAIFEGEVTDVYDITVEDTHNFIADGIIVHNCGEQPLPKNGACNLGSINLSKYVIWGDKSFKYNEFVKDVKICVRGLDEIIDENLNNHALSEQREMSYNYRNIGLGVMGFADMFIKLGIIYGSEESLKLTDKIMKLMLKSAVEASVELAVEKGSFPKYRKELFDSTILKNIFTESELEEFKILGIRNCSLLSIAPTGSLGTMFNISTGIEPNFALEYIRKTESLEGNKESYHKVFAGIAEEYTTLYNTDKLPECFVTSHDINWRDRIKIQAVAQNYIDTAISATINLPEDITVEEVENLYIEAWKQGLKGVTIYRNNCRKGILSLTEEINKQDNFFERGDILKAKVVHFNNEGVQWIAFIGIKNNKPFEIFSGPSDMELFPIPKSIKDGEIIKVKSEESTRYDFRYTDKYGYVNTLGGLSRMFNKEYWNYARLISGMFRNQVELDSIISIIDSMHSDSESLHSWKNGVIRSIKTFIEDGTLSLEKCSVCGGELIYTGGCKQCAGCGDSKCN